jgi:hypothetical protein
MSGLLGSRALLPYEGSVRADPDYSDKPPSNWASTSRCNPALRADSMTVGETVPLAQLVKKGLPGGTDQRSNVSLPPLARRFAGLPSGAFDMNNGKPGIRFPAAEPHHIVPVRGIDGRRRSLRKRQQNNCGTIDAPLHAPFAKPRRLGYFCRMAPHVRNNLIELFPRREIVTARWIIGSDAYAGQDYLFHTDYPAFFAKIGHSRSDAFLSRLSHSTSADRIFYDYVWLDPPPDEVTFLSLMREAEDALQARRVG